MCRRSAAATEARGCAIKQLGRTQAAQQAVEHEQGHEVDGKRMVGTRRRVPGYRRHYNRSTFVWPRKVDQQEGVELGGFHEVDGKKVVGDISVLLFDTGAAGTDAIRDFQAGGCLRTERVIREPVYSLCG